MKALLAIIIGLTVLLGLHVSGLVTFSWNNAHATGCPVDTIIPFIDDAMKSLEQGDTQTAQSQLQEAKNQLKDTFEIKDE